MNPLSRNEIGERDAQQIRDDLWCLKKRKQFFVAKSF